MNGTFRKTHLVLICLFHREYISNHPVLRWNQINLKYVENISQFCEHCIKAIIIKCEQNNVMKNYEAPSIDNNSKVKLKIRQFEYSEYILNFAFNCLPVKSIFFFIPFEMYFVLLLFIPKCKLWLSLANIAS